MDDATALSLTSIMVDTVIGVLKQEYVKAAEALKGAPEGTDPNAIYMAVADQVLGIVKELPEELTQLALIKLTIDLTTAEKRIEQLKTEKKPKVTRQS